ncbi:hypothetical protein Gotri_003048, partial [Gossypium trilobum]|nr:hypothetical protein [Gossypium trilobum]
MSFLYRGSGVSLGPIQSLDVSHESLLSQQSIKQDIGLALLQIRCAGKFMKARPADMQESFKDEIRDFKKSCISGVEEMEVIMDEVNLEARHVLRWKFRDHSRTLSGRRTDLTVTDGNERWQFECCRSEEGDNTYYIRCPAWSDF